MNILSHAVFLMTSGPYREQKHFINKAKWLVKYMYLNDDKVCQKRHSASAICQLNKQLHLVCVYILLRYRSLNKVFLFWPEISITNDFIILWCINEKTDC